MKPITLKKEIPLPTNLLRLNTLFKKSGYDLYVVGGAVRDFLLGEPIKDYDLATNSSPNEIKDLLNENNINTVLTGENFGVINAFIEGEEFEIATFRNDGVSSDGRRPDSVNFTTIEGDVLRRDLKINALFYDIEKGQIVDFVGGLSDIENGIISTVGDPYKRFGEDKLRVMRAIRFANRTGYELDPKIDKYLMECDNLFGVSRERIRDEFLKSINTTLSVWRLKDLMTFGYKSRDLK